MGGQSKSRFLFEEIGGLHVGHGQGEGQGILGKGLPHQAAVLGAGKAHVPADGHGLLPGQADKAVDHIDRLLPVAIGQRVFIEKGGHLGPLAVLPLHVSGGGLVAADLAHVVEQGDQ